MIAALKIHLKKISKNNLNTPHICITFGEIQEKNTKELQRNFSTSQKVFLAVEILSNEKGQSLQHLILKDTTIKLKEKK